MPKKQLVLPIESLNACLIEVTLRLQKYSQYLDLDEVEQNDVVQCISTIPPELLQDKSIETGLKQAAMALKQFVAAKNPTPENQIQSEHGLYIQTLLLQRVFIELALSVLAKVDEQRLPHNFLALIKSYQSILKQYFRSLGDNPPLIEKTQIKIYLDNAFSDLNPREPGFSGKTRSFYFSLGDKNYPELQYVDGDTLLTRLNNLINSLEQRQANSSQTLEERKLEVSQNVINTLRAKVLVLLKEIDFTTGLLLASGEKIKTLNECNTQLLSVYEANKVKYHNKEEQVVELQNKVDKLQKKLARLKSQYEKLNHQIKEITDIKKSDDEQFEKLKKELITTEKKFVDQLRKNTEMVYDLNKILEKIKSELKKSRDKINELTGKNTRLENENKTLLKRNEDLSNNVKGLRHSNEEKNKEIADLKKSNKEKDEELKNLKKQLQSQHKNNQKTKIELSKKKQRVEERELSLLVKLASVKEELDQSKEQQLLLEEQLATEQAAVRNKKIAGFDNLGHYQRESATFIKFVMDFILALQKSYETSDEALCQETLSRFQEYFSMHNPELNQQILLVKQKIAEASSKNQQLQSINQELVKFLQKNSDLIEGVHDLLNEGFDLSTTLSVLYTMLSSHLTEMNGLQFTYIGLSDKEILQNCLEQITELKATLSCWINQPNTSVNKPSFWSASNRQSNHYAPNQTPVAASSYQLAPNR